MISIHTSDRIGTRLHSLDALRGLDMLCIIGLDALVHVLPGLFPWPFFSALSGQFTHVDWMGCRVYDLIFPLFVFISGMAMAYSINRRLWEGKSRLSLSGDVVKRGIALVVIGLVMNGILDLNFGQVRYPSVLGLIGLSTMLGGLAVIWLRSKRNLLVCASGLLITVGCFQYFCGDFTPGGNFNSMVDRYLLPGRLYRGVFDPEGIICCVSASFLAITGYLTGLYTQRTDVRPYQAVLTLVVSGMATVALASGLAYALPVIKSMCTPSFNMLALGWALIVFGLAYLLADVWCLRRWFFPLEVIGFNALAIYVAQEFINFNQINVRLFNGVARLSGEYMPLVLAVTLILLKWWPLYGMKKANYRVRIG